MDKELKQRINIVVWAVIYWVAAIGAIWLIGWLFSLISFGLGLMIGFIALIGFTVIFTILADHFVDRLF